MSYNVQLYASSWCSADKQRLSKGDQTCTTLKKKTCMKITYFLVFKSWSSKHILHSFCAEGFTLLSFCRDIGGVSVCLCVCDSESSTLVPHWLLFPWQEDSVHACGRPQECLSVRVPLGSWLVNNHNFTTKLVQQCQSLTSLANHDLLFEWKT